MKARELRIGNYFKHSLFQGDLEIQAINKSGLCSAKGVSGGFEIEHIKPIPLTEAWLLKFGFSCEAKIGGDGIEFRVYHFDVLTFNTNHGWWYKCQPMNDTPLEYVHQLQNFYFALTGKELTLKP
jgi:hypothetical protein